MNVQGVEFPEAEIAAICRASGVVRLSLFGSILTADFSPDSDVDLLVEFAPGTNIGLMAFAGLQESFAGVVKRRVHLHTINMLPPAARATVRGSARVQYAA